MIPLLANLLEPRRDWLEINSDCRWFDNLVLAKAKDKLGHSQKRFSLATEAARAKLRSRKMPGMAARTLIESA